MAQPLDPDSFYGAMAQGYAERARVNATRTLPLYHWSRREVLYNTFRQRERFVDALRAWGRLDLSQLEILDVGCGSASFLRWLLEIGASARRLHGVEAMAAHADESRRRSPDLDIRLTDGLSLPFPDQSLDLVTANVVFFVDRRRPLPRRDGARDRPRFETGRRDVFVRLALGAAGSTARRAHSGPGSRSAVPGVPPQELVVVPSAAAGSALEPVVPGPRHFARALDPLGERSPLPLPRKALTRRRGPRDFAPPRARV